MENDYKNTFGLTIKRESFAQYVVAHGKTMTEAYKKAYDCTGMSTNSIKVEASRLAKHPKVAERIAVLRHRASVRNDLSFDKLLAKLAGIAFDGKPSQTKTVTTTTNEGVMTVKTEVCDNIRASITLLEYLHATWKEPSKEKSGAIGTVEAKAIEKKALEEEMKHMRKKEAEHRKEVEKVIAEAELEMNNKM